jgi:hypothetical protein
MKGQLDYAALQALTWQVPLVLLTVGALFTWGWRRIWP